MGCLGPRGRRTARLGCSLCGLLLLLAQLGGGGRSSSSAIGSVRDRAMRGAPTLGPPPAASPNPIWVPDRTVPSPMAPLGVRIPGHWEQPYGPGQYYVPPLTICDQATSVCSVLPGGVQGPVDQRPLPQDPAILRGGSSLTSP